MKLDIQESQDRLDVLDGTTIPTINEQIAAIDSSILDLQEMDKTLDGYIKSLESTAADLQKQIGENKTEVELELAIINKTLAELKLADLTLEKKVTDLQTYVDTELSSAKDWAEATFSTLTQYEQTQTEISAIKASIEQVNADLKALDTRLDGKIEARTTELLSAIAASETNLKTWVGEQLAQSYYDIATLDGILSALSARLDEADTDLQKQVDEQKEALKDAKSELTAAYTSAIKDAISENNGIINASIATAVQKLEDKIQARLTVIDVNISNIQKELANMSKDIASIFEQIAGISSSISDLKGVDKDLDAYIKSLEGELAKMREEFESEKVIDEQEKQLLSQKIVELNALIQALQTKDAMLESKIDSLQTYVAVELQEISDWANATFATLEQYSAIQAEISAIKTLIDKTKADITEEYTTAIEIAISNSETSMKAWVNTLLAQGYYTISDINGKVSALETLINDADSNLQEQIDEQKTALQQAKTDLTNEYKQYINQAIASGGVIDQAIASKVKSAQDKLQEKIDTISDRIDDLEDRISKLENDFVNQIQSLKYVPEYSNRVALMSDYYKSVSVDFLITPVSQAAVLAESWVKESSIIKAFLRYTKVPETRAVNPAIPLVVTSVSSNEEGLLSVTVGENPSYPLNAEFLNGEVPAVLYLHISDGNTEILSDLVDVKTFLEEKLDLSSIMSANSYIVSKAGVYKFKAVQGNSDTSVGTVASAEVLWETFGTDEVPEVGDLVKYVSCEDGYIAFQTADTFREGNAVIAAKDANGNILWSWHIWLTRKPQGQVYYNSAGTMMDRNLGATSATPGDVGALGLLYQWGRKDPFLGSSSISLNVLAKSTITWPSTVSSTSSTGTIDYATKNPTTFITRNDSNSDWYYTGSEETDNTRWTTSDKAKSIYDPCPPGWRVPDGRGNGVWAKALGSSLEFSCSISMGKGIEFSGKFGSGYTIWYPASGGRSSNDGSLGNVGYHGRYWSASPGSDCRACLLYFDDHGFVSLSYISLRANGWSVRCIQEGSWGPSEILNAVDLSSSESANSYIISKAGAYKLKTVQGNSETSVGAVVSASVLWETFGTGETPAVGDLVKNISYADDYIAFETNSTFKEGNAVIAAKDASGEILWSWHIWFTDAPQGQEYYNDAGTMMDRNLGATSATPGDVGALGLLYQWGRKDPFLGSSSISSSTLAKSTITWPSVVSSNSSSGTIAYATKNPTTFITYNSSNYDWYYTGLSSTDSTRWTTSSSAKSIYDPCPAGWRVPDGGSNGVWSKALGSSSYFTQSSLYSSTNDGMNFSGEFGSASTIWYPASGYLNRDVGSLSSVGYDGSYWSASTNDYLAYCLYFGSGGGVEPSNCSTRAYTRSVRCLQVID